MSAATTKKPKEKIEGLLPVNYELALQIRNREVYDKVLDLLRSTPDFYTFESRTDYVDNRKCYIVTISGSWGNNLIEVIKVISDIENEHY